MLLCFVVVGSFCYLFVWSLFFWVIPFCLVKEVLNLLHAMAKRQEMGFSKKGSPFLKVWPICHFYFILIFLKVFKNFQNISIRSINPNNICKKQKKKNRIVTMDNRVGAVIKLHSRCVNK